MIKIGWSQDQHLVHKRLGVERPIKALKELFPDNEETGELDCLFYGGDFFDHLIDGVDNKDFHFILDYIAWRLKSAEKRGYAVRLLKGTPSHDRDQNIYWETIYKLLGCKADFRYVDKLSIEHHPKLGHILYIPDQWKPTADEVWLDVQQALTENNISKVDWIIMHGAFKFQLPKDLHNRMPFLHDEKRFEEIVRNYCLVGHVHIHERCGKIISAGSLDRSSFGEEKSKGVLRITIDGDKHQVKFIENKHARGMFSKVCTDMSVDETCDWIRQTINDYGDVSYMSIRLLDFKDSPTHLNFDAICRAFPDLELKYQDLDGKREHNIIRLDEDNQQPYDMKSVTLEVFNQMLIERIKKTIQESKNSYTYNEGSILDKIDNLFDIGQEANE